MAKTTKSTSFYDTVNEFITIAKQRGVVHLYSEDEEINGRTIRLKGHGNLVNFGSCSYLGLEKDQRLIESGKQYLEKFGSQFSSSRAYVSISPYAELENLLGKIFKRPLLLSPNSTLGHMGTVPAIIEDHDAIIMDHQAHISMYHATKLIDKKVTITLLRHSRLDELQRKIDELSPTHNRIWYFMDGIYSMYGDVSPAKEVIQMLDRNRQMYLYVDDAHGMSWMGKHGAGYFMSEIKEHHPKMILSTSLAKSFGSSGGVFVFPNEEMCWKVRTWGGPLTYSGPQQPATLGCSIASAKIHLSDEIILKQEQLLKKIKLCNEVLKHHQVPLVSETNVPIRFVGVGLPKVGYNLVYKLIKEGYYTNLGVYPAVPETCTGIRFTITNQLTEDDVVGLGESIARNLPLALKEEDRSMEDIYRAFKMLRTRKAADEIKPSPASVSKFTIETKTSIDQINEQEWNSVLGENGVYDWKGLRLLERIFQGNEKVENNWKFSYYLVRNETGTLVAATFFTLALSKDDMLSPAEVSEKIEAQRKEDPYYLTSKCYMMGSLISEGQHLWIDRNHPDWKEFTMLLLDEIWKEYEIIQADALYLRDFPAEDIELRNYFVDRGFLKADMPNRNVIEEMNWQTPEEFLMQLPQKKRNRLRREVIRYEDYFETRMVRTASEEEINYWYSLYLNIHNKNLRINSFALPKKMFAEMTGQDNVDILELWLKPEFDKREERKPVAVGFIYKTAESYFPWVLGMDYEFREFHIYRQLIYKAILRAKELDRKKISLGFTADEEKGKFGATSTPTVSYIQVRDNFNLSVIGIIKR